jgi:hypothetical protein
MEKERADEIKIELINSIEYGKPLSKESIQDLIGLINKIYKKTKLSKDKSPMIGINPFKKLIESKSEVKVKSNKDFNKSLNYRIQKFEDE